LKARASRARSAARAARSRLYVAGIPALLACVARAQYDPTFLMRTQPTPTFSEPPKRDYNLKWGPVTARFHGSLQTEYSDNINLAERNAQSDVYFFPNFGVGFQWPISPQNILEFNLGAGYRAYVNHPELNTLQVAPDSRLLYQMRVGKVGLVFHDSFYLQVDPLSRPDINGSPAGGILNFKRFANDIGVQGEWQARRNLAIVSQYSYLMDRSLNSEFTSLDRDDHTFALGFFSNVGASWNVGVNGAVTFSDYLQNIQNDGVSETIGPQVTVKISRFITADATIGYTHSEFDHAGAIADRSNFNGLSYSMGLRHKMNSRLEHSLHVAHSISPGFGSNFLELTVAQYGLKWNFNSFLTLNSSFSYEHFDSSDALGESADRYLFYAGTGWQVARRWNLGVGYSFAWKNSDQPLRDYVQNRVTLDLTHNF
jgi:hypothetical protein